MKIQKCGACQHRSPKRSTDKRQGPASEPHSYRGSTSGQRYLTISCCQLHFCTSGQISLLGFFTDKPVKLSLVIYVQTMLSGRLFQLTVVTKLCVISLKRGGSRFQRLARTISLSRCCCFNGCLILLPGTYAFPQPRSDDGDQRIECHVRYGVKVIGKQVNTVCY